MEKHKKQAQIRKLIQKLKKQIKKEDPFLDKCKKYNRDPDFVDDVKISFEPIDVSAKTIDGDIVINEQLLEDGDWDDIMRYVIHEMTHVMQQEAGKVDGVVDKEDYLEDKNEIEAFNVQIEYMDEHVSDKELQEYLENLLDHHGVEGKERRKILRTLTKDIRE